MNISEIKSIAREKMVGKKLNLWIGMLVAGAINGALSGLTGGEDGNSLLYLIVTFALYPLQIGLIKYSLNLYRGKQFDVMDIFSEYKNSFTIISACFLVGIIVACGYILLIVPGIIWALGYSLVQYLLADGETSGALEILKKSKQMMNGYKMDYCLLLLSFLGWIVLGVFTFGILYIWLIPYMTFAQIEFYDQIKAKYNQQTI